MGSFYDAIESLMDFKDFNKKEKIKTKKPKNENVELKKPEISVDGFIDQFKKIGVIETKTFTYMRERTLTDALVIVDEAFSKFTGSLVFSNIKLLKRFNYYLTKVVVKFRIVYITSFTLQCI